MDTSSNSSATTITTSPGLVRGLGGWAAPSIVVGTMIGTGIFLKPSEMAADTGSAEAVFAAWIAGGLLSISGALAYAELGAAIPEAGGEYAYLSRALGPAWGFLFGWMHCIVGRPASAASIAAGLLRFLGFLLPALASPLYTLHFHLPFLAALSWNFTFTLAQPLAVVALILVTVINYLGVRLGGEVQVVLTFLKITSVLTIIVLAFVLGHGGADFHPLLSRAPRWSTATGFLAALAASLWAYDGWEDLNLVGSEVRAPGRNIPRALVGGVAFVAIVYLLFSAVCFYVLPFQAVATSHDIASDIVGGLAGHRAALSITLVIVISALGTLNSSVMSGARVDYAMARDGIFFRAMAAVHPKFRTPGNALIFQCCLASLLALSGTFEDLTSLFIFSTWIFYGLAVVALFRLRQVEPHLSRPYRTWGYPALPAIFILGAAALTVSLWVARPLRSSIGLILILSGLLFYRNWRKQAQTTEPGPKVLAKGL